MEGRIPAALKEMFGDEVLDHALVLLTCADYLMRMSVQVFKLCSLCCHCVLLTYAVVPLCGSDHRGNFIQHCGICGRAGQIVCPVPVVPSHS